MNRKWQRWLSVYLVLCLMGAGMVGLSPWLHHWVEHGGVGAYHVHSVAGFRSVSSSPSHDDLHRSGMAHRHDHGPVAVHPGAARPAIFRHQDSFGLAWSRMKEWLVCRIGMSEESADSPSDSSDGHEHHGLVEAMLSGGLDLAADDSIPRLLWTGCILVRLGGVDFSYSAFWFAPTAGRGPPAV